MLQEILPPPIYLSNKDSRNLDGVVRGGGAIGGSGVAPEADQKPRMSYRERVFKRTPSQGDRKEISYTLRGRETYMAYFLREENAPWGSKGVQPTNEQKISWGRKTSGKGERGEELRSKSRQLERVPGGFSGYAIKGGNPEEDTKTVQI